jgi:hypothetical protein
MEKIEVAAEEEIELLPHRSCNYAPWWLEPLKTPGTKATEDLAGILRKYNPSGLFSIELLNSGRHRATLLSANANNGWVVLAHALAHSTIAVVR